VFVAGKTCGMSLDHVVLGGTLNRQESITSTRYRLYWAAFLKISF